MITLQDFLKTLDEIIQAVETEMPTITDEAAMNALALVKNRIIDRGEGIQGANYSTRPMLATKDQFIVKSAFKQTQIEPTSIQRNKNGNISKARSKKKKQGLWIKFPNASKAVPVMVLENGYREFREIQGRPGDHVNGSLTGKMWQGVTIISRVRQGLLFMTLVGGNNTDAQNKLIWLRKQYGPFLTLLPDEKEKVKLIYETRLNGLIVQRFTNLISGNKI